MRRTEAAPERELIEVDQQTTLQIYTEGDLTGLLEDVKKKVLENTPENPDFSDKKTRDIFRANAASVARAKTKFDGAGKGLTDEWKSKSKKVDTVRKFFRDAMDYFKAEYRQPLTEWEAKEAKKAEELRLTEDKRIEDERIAKEELERIEKKRIEDELEAKRLDLEKREAEMAQKEEQQRQKVADELAEKERLEREDRLQKEAVEAEKKRAAKEKERLVQKEIKAKLEKKQAEDRFKQAELDKVKAEKQAEIDRKNVLERVESERKEAAELAEKEKKEAVAEAERRAKVEAQNRENQRLHTERIEKDKADKKAANVKHQKKINNAAMERLIDVLNALENSEFDSTDTAQAIIKAIVKGEIPHITVNY